jgi:type 1 glutamine amidotransferase
LVHPFISALIAGQLPALKRSHTVRKFWGLPCLTALVVSVALCSVTSAADKIRVLIIDGINNHNWKDTTPLLKKHLEKTGKFTVSVSTTPGAKAAAGEWAAWKPDFSQCDVVLSNYNGPKWPDHVRSAFEKFIREGGGLVNVHAANNAHNGWDEFEKMTGLLWRNNRHGWRLAFDKNRKEVRMKAGEGPGAGHGPQHEYQVVVIEPDHPITRGMPLRWQHTKDELYHGQRGPAADMHVLAIAFSDKSYRGTGYYEPMLWWIPYGKGKVVTTVLGHVGRGDSTNMVGMRCVGFLTIVERSCEWAATGKVTIPIPDNFPSADKTSIVPLP